MAKSRTKALLGLLAFVLVGSTFVASASAGPGPFWYHRPVGESTGSGLKVAANAPEGFKGGGEEQRLTGTIGGEAVEIASKSVQVKGALFNNVFQGQVKLELIYNQPHVVKPAALASTCVVRIGEKNIVQVKGHLMWKYTGVAKELTEQGAAGQKPELVFTPKEIAQGATALPGGVFAELHFATTGCGVFTTIEKVEGSQVGFGSPSGLEEWSTNLAVRTAGGENQLVHFWNGEKNIEGKAELLFGSNKANLIGQTEVKANQQEIAVKES